MTAFRVPHPCAVCCTKTQKKKKKRANTRVLGMVANGMDACVNMSCSMSFAQCVVQTGENTVNTSVLGMAQYE